MAEEFVDRRFYGFGLIEKAGSPSINTKVEDDKLFRMVNVYQENVLDQVEKGFPINDLGTRLNSFDHQSCEVQLLTPENVMRFAGFLDARIDSEVLAYVHQITCASRNLFGLIKASIDHHIPEEFTGSKLIRRGELLERVPQLLSGKYVEVKYA